MKKQPKIFHLLQLAHSALFRKSDAWLKKHEQLGTAQLTVLFALNRRNGLPLTELADLLDMRYSSMSGLIDRMLKKKLVEKVSDDEDKRVQKIMIMDDGRAIAERQLSMVSHVNRQLLEPFSFEERETIGRFLLHVSQHANHAFPDNTCKDGSDKDSLNAYKESTK